MRSEKLKIAVTGLAGTYPFGGVFWDYMQYVLGFHRLGHDVLYIEDTGNWCYDTSAQTFVASGARNAHALGESLALLDPELKSRWFLRDAEDQTYGRPWADVKQFLRDADLFLHISASCWMRDEYAACKRLAFIDSDPMYTQASIPHYLAGTANEQERKRVDMIRSHHAHFTFGENFGAPDCAIPAGLIDWQPTRQPIVISCFEPHRVPVHMRRKVLTTVASWEPTEKGPVINGVMYRGKSAEFTRLMNLPQRSPLPLELAMSGRAPVDQMKAAGWHFKDPGEISATPWLYRSYLADSLAEWSVAKNAYAASRSGWFSCRSACYLALGVPVIVQDTGFTHAIPSGEGVLAFTTLDEAVAAIEQIARDPDRHATAAANIATQYFDSGKVLASLIERAFISPTPRERHLTATAF